MMVEILQGNIIAYMRSTMSIEQGELTAIYDNVPLVKPLWEKHVENGVTIEERIGEPIGVALQDIPADEVGPVMFVGCKVLE